MANMEELLKRTTIAFKLPVTEEPLKNLVQYLTRNIEGFRVDYFIERKGRFGIGDNTLINEERPTKYGGRMVASSNEKIRMATFECPLHPLEGPINLNRDNLFYGFKFFIIPGYDLEELPKGEISLIDEVREKTQEFFKSINE